MVPTPYDHAITTGGGYQGHHGKVGHNIYTGKTILTHTWLDIDHQDNSISRQVNDPSLLYEECLMYFANRQWHNNDSDEFLVSPILDFTPPFAQPSFERKNSTSPAPPTSILNQQQRTKPMASQSTSSDEMSPQTPRMGRHPLDALDYDLFNKRPMAATTTTNCTRCRREVANDAIRIGQEVKCNPSLR